jgi:hypothetical protein
MFFNGANFSNESVLSILTITVYDQFHPAGHHSTDFRQEIAFFG